MRYTPENDLLLAEVLGIPSCCAQAWVHDITSGVPRLRYRYAERSRSLAESHALSLQATQLLKISFDFTRDLEKAYVLCDACATEKFTSSHADKITILPASIHSSYRTAIS
jgi:hypothetical protein